MSDEQALFFWMGNGGYGCGCEGQKSEFHFGKARVGGYPSPSVVYLNHPVSGKTGNNLWGSTA